jgi:hypothetical protein
MPNRGRRPLVVIATMLAVLLVVTACGRAGEARTLHRSVEQGTATAVDVELDMGVGSLRLARGGERLLDVTVETTIGNWEPEIVYSVAGQHGELTVRQPSNTTRRIRFGKPRYAWDVRLGEQATLNLDVQLGAGRSELVLAGLDVSGLNVETGAGETTIDLRGDWTRAFDSTIKVGAGRVIVILPAGTGVAVTSETGFGTVETDGLTRRDGALVNAVYGTTAVTLRVAVEAGAGTVELRVRE